MKTILNDAFEAHAYSNHIPTDVAFRNKKIAKAILLGVTALFIALTIYHLLEKHKKMKDEKQG